ncbi:LysR family transcriptional regulator [Bradyrhizobium sp. RDM4]|uniref:LysR family transcriptional regulator n=1 Tax=Bradyrhizobium sp. RDM4 TaxID=3378765 RepID=UPI0038FD30EF
MLGLTQSTISRRIAQLEGRLGVRLLARTTRHVSLTPSGEAFAEQARRAISLLRGAEAELGAGERTAAGLIRITAPTAFGRACLVPGPGGTDGGPSGVADRPRSVGPIPRSAVERRRPRHWPV